MPSSWSKPKRVPSYNSWRKGKRAPSYNSWRKGKRVPSYNSWRKGKRVPSYNSWRKGKRSDTNTGMKRDSYTAWRKGKRGPSYDSWRKGKRGPSYNNWRKGKRVPENNSQEKVIGGSLDLAKTGYSPQNGLDDAYYDPYLHEWFPAKERPDEPQDNEILQEEDVFFFFPTSFSYSDQHPKFIENLRIKREVPVGLQSPGNLLFLGISFNVIYIHND